MNKNALSNTQASTVTVLDPDLGSCGRAGRQQPNIVVSNDDAAGGETDTFGRRIDRRQRALDEGLAVRRQNWVSWPVFGTGLNLPDGSVFPWHLYRQAFHRGTIICVYIAVSDGMLTLAKKTRLSLSKIGTSSRPHLAARMAEANTDRYGSLHEEDGRIVDEDGFGTWEPVRLPPKTGPIYESPVERLPRVLMVSLPDTFSIEAFDAELTNVLASCELARWIATTDGEHHCARHDVDPRRLRRFTAHINADATVRLKPSREIYVFRLREDTDRFTRAIEGLIARHLFETDSVIAAISAHGAFANQDRAADAR